MRDKLIIISVSLLAVLLAVFVSQDTAGASGFEPQVSATPKARSNRNIVVASGQFDGKMIVKTDAEWKALLSDVEFNVLRQEGTERPYTGSLLKNKSGGTYHCAACGLALFSSKHKYESNTGWPSFYQPLYKKNVAEKSDTALGEARIEVECARCGGHLGHVFDDGPEPTGLRYCMNSVAMKFKAGR